MEGVVEALWAPSAVAVVEGWPPFLLLLPEAFEGSESATISKSWGLSALREHQRRTFGFAGHRVFETIEVLNHLVHDDRLLVRKVDLALFGLLQFEAESVSRVDCLPKHSTQSLTFQLPLHALLKNSDLRQMMFLWTDQIFVPQTMVRSA